MAKRKQPAKKKVSKRASPRREQPATETESSTEEASIVLSNLSLHDLFQQQAMQMLENTDLDEEQKQSILVAMNCPCCGAGGMSYTVKIKRRT